MDDIIVAIRETPVASAIFVLTLVASILAFNSDEIYDLFILHPYTVSRGKRIYTLFTSGLIHKDITHLFFNLFSYYYFAFILERNYMGHWQFALLYLASLILSDMPTVLKYKDEYQYYSLGASGAISAVVFSFILFNPWAGMGLIFIPFLHIPSVVFGILYLVYCSYASRRGIGNVNHDAHFYGAVCGIIITIGLYPIVVLNFFHILGNHLGFNH